MRLPLALTLAAIAAGALRLIARRVRFARQARRNLVLASTRTVPTTSDPALLGRIADAAGLTFTHDNDIAVVRNSDGIIHHLLGDIGRARRSVTLQVYYARPGAVATELAELLGQRARAGVQVRVLFDALGCRGLGACFSQMRAHGIGVALMRPLLWYAPHRFTYRAHSRIAVVDGRIGYTGGFGIADEWRDGPDPSQYWQDISVRFTGSTVEQAQLAFADAWAETTGELLRGPAFFPPLRTHRPGQTAAFLRTAPCHGRFGARSLFEYALSSARRSIYATTGYFAPSDDLVALLSRAVRRGVDVRVLATGEATDIRIVRWAGRSIYDRLLRDGIRIYEYVPTMLHAKTMVIDGVLASIGAINFDRRSLEVNDETTLVLKDAVIGAELDRMFHRDLRDAREIEIEHFSTRSWVERAYEEMARPLREQL